jgi:hypothetical protein
MPIPDPKRASLQDQVNGKVQWNATDDEVLTWLWERHQIRGPDASEMIAKGRWHRARIVRERSCYGLILCAVGATLCGLMIGMQWLDGVFFIRRGFVILTAFALCVAWFLRYLFRFLSGRADMAE